MLVSISVSPGFADVFGRLDIGTSTSASLRQDRFSMYLMKEKQLTTYGRERFMASLWS
jgi:hypothetical protein